MGILNFEDKLEVIKSLLGTTADTDVFDRLKDEKLITGGKGQKNPALKGNIKNWKKGINPRADWNWFFEAWIKGFYDDKTTPVTTLKGQTIDEFKKHLDQDSKDHLRRVGMLASPTLGVSSVTGSSSSHPYFRTISYRRALYKSLQDPNTLAINKLSQFSTNQAFNYLSDEAANDWISLVSSKSYPTYQYCKEGIEAVLRTEKWKKLTEGRSTVVNLAGGGAPDKDELLINDRLDIYRGTETQINYYIVDISFYMNTYTFDMLEGQYSRITNLNLNSVIADVTTLGSENPPFKSDKKIFAIQGGTLGNMDESKFLESLNNMSKPGDLIMVAADTYEERTKEWEDELLAKYDNPEFKLWLNPLIKKIAKLLKDAEKLSLPILELIKELNNSVSISVFDGLSKVDGALSVASSIQAYSREFNLVSSTRYKKDKLTEFFLNYGWECKLESLSKTDPKFMQFVFQKSKNP